MSFAVGSGAVENNLRELRLARKMALTQLAVQSGASTSTIVAIEKYYHLPGDDLRRRLAAVLEVDVEEIWPTITAN